VNNILGSGFRTAARVAIAAVLIFAPSTSHARAASPAGQAANATAGNAQNGKSIFVSQKCGSCHGSDGQGGTGQVAGPQIIPPRLGLAMFTDVVRNPKDPMPAFSVQDISDAGMADLYAFLRTSAAPAQPSAAQASAPPSGNADNGRMLYVKIGCYECHDRDAEGAGTGPRLAPNPLPWAAFSHQVRQPVNSMPPYTAKVLSDAELADIYAFLQTLPKPPALASIPLLQP
jgi:mono/diheme cytochrome c family protein